MNTSQNNFEEIRKLYKPVFEALERALNKFEIDYYLIGAQSRDVWTNHLGINHRITRDIDFAVYLPDQKIWNELTYYLVNSENFLLDKSQPYRFTRDEFILDLIPFGGLEKNSEVILENPHTALSVYGCREVTEEAVIISDRYKVISLAGLCIMKLIAFDEKPERRSKDWEDFVLILHNYGLITGDALYEFPHEDLITDDFDFPLASARLLGRHLQSIVNKNVKLKARIIKIIQTKLDPYTAEEIDRMYGVNEGNDRQIVLLKLISQTLLGLSDQFW